MNIDQQGKENQPACRIKEMKKITVTIVTDTGSDPGAELHTQPQQSRHCNNQNWIEYVSISTTEVFHALIGDIEKVMYPIHFPHADLRHG